MSVSAHCTRLHNGMEMPLVGFGTFQGSYECNQETVYEASKTAIDAGYRLLDTAQVYNTETGVGRAIKEKIAEGKITREQIFVTTKLWSHAHKRRNVIPALKNSLRTLGLDYVDMFLVHWPVALTESPDNLFPRDDKGDLIFDDNIDYLETWQGMEDALESGLTKAIGVSNFNQQQLQRLLDYCKVKPMNQQIESNPYFNNNALIEFCQKNGMTVTAFSPLGKPSRTWQNKPGDPFVASDPVLLELGKKYGKSPQQLFDFSLTDEEMTKIVNLDRNFRILWINFFRPSREYPFEGSGESV